VPAFGETNSNWDASKLGRVSPESLDEAVDRGGEDCLVPSEVFLCGGEFESADDVVSLDRWWSSPFFEFTY
jgi:hypothetical protein